MAGHSKWANIKHKKEKMDAKKGRIFTKLTKDIIKAAKEGGGDPETNSKLKLAIERAKAFNLPSENIQRAIKRGTGELGGAKLEEVIYEGYGPAGTAIIVEALTDNKNRTAGEIRHIFDRNGGTLGAAGSVTWMFDKVGVIVVEKTDSINEEDLMMVAIEAGAEDFSADEGEFEIITDPSNFQEVREAIEKAGYKISEAEITMLPKNTIKLSPEDYEKFEKLIDKLEDNDDVQNVYHNVELEDE
ncbi:YebC/PmpR family DNA-binding regulatory protein [Caldanaerobacter subterraneus subsp. tengcongensis MB4]|uniref:Probable transcriptional regulatory protein TTE1135 n=1 Tax=Caldanaerobacter subterraneus subsp. tengcongensis (strain DSM 15242 / JCM 11007 / NBRC 100824 / MB4) TaxID=273068 RepID=Y1135_CALS4|nr:YebC/PmpR family DNA-binding transcriptional regulator [Caldanaerobacter subterraneus]Q8RAR7.2 RecName: Full=Probable transcriptional regulatory protein TTE1135 [Caldanaerobacter subterraneus subsp. tengcongensis MB4]MBE3579683.1 YebC/PmpR family DNA-binding transcriptional regulator [Caldanaerobacter subterraneus]MCS3916084.1 YebC/PmpR family DNA-binding regulatory protein [Caldanaerobacter subterraneus subsp. tengcongensis MB4]